MADGREKLAAIWTPQGANQPETIGETPGAVRKLAMRLRHEGPGATYSGGVGVRHSSASCPVIAMK